MSAENLKCREDLNQERYFNELSRKNIMQEMEQEFGKGTRPSEIVVKAQDDIFRPEVREKARELAKNDPKKGQICEKGKQSYHLCKHVFHACRHTHPTFWLLINSCDSVEKRTNKLLNDTYIIALFLGSCKTKKLCMELV